MHRHKLLAALAAGLVALSACSEGVGGDDEIRGDQGEFESGNVGEDDGDLY